MEPSDQARHLIHNFEDCAEQIGKDRYRAYPDPGSRDGTPWTIGWGSTGSDVRKGTIWSKSQCDARFDQDLRAKAKQLTQLLGKTPTTQAQFDALLSFTYNLGIGQVRTSTLIRLHKDGLYVAAAEEFKRWVFNDGKRMRGLVKRRAAEEALYLSQLPQP